MKSNNKRDNATKSRQRALERIIEKRRENHIAEINKFDFERERDAGFRLKWRSNVKEKKVEEVDCVLDQEILKNTIKNDPKSLLYSDDQLEHMRRYLLDEVEISYHDDTRIDLEPRHLDSLLMLPYLMGANVKSSHADSSSRRESQTESVVQDKVNANSTPVEATNNTSTTSPEMARKKSYRIDHELTKGHITMPRAKSFLERAIKTVVESNGSTAKSETFEKVQARFVKLTYQFSSFHVPLA
jgi:hypothetical protein